MTKTKEDWEASAKRLFQEAETLEFRGNELAAKARNHQERASEIRSAAKAIFEMAETMASVA